MSAVAEAELLVIALPGVQRFIAEARSTGDVRAASEVFAGLATTAAQACRDEPGSELIFPARGAGTEGMPNRVVALLPAGTGAQTARKARAEVTATWQSWVRRALGLPAGAALPQTPGMPVVPWVVVPAAPGGYKDQWITAQRLLAARRRVRDFSPAVEWLERDLCSVGPRWPAVKKVPAGLREHEKDTLSAAGWVKRRWPRPAGFPSTASIASAPFRKEVLGRLDDHEVRAAVSELTAVAQEVIRAASAGRDVRESPVPGLLPQPDGEPASWFASTAGPWVYPDQWQPESLAREMKLDRSRIEAAAQRGLQAARRLGDLMKESGVPALASYLAVLTADLDSMGRFLGGIDPAANRSRIEVTPDVHKSISAAIQELAGAQYHLLRGSGLLGVPVYAGGDDLLAFLPAATVLDAARQCHDKIPPSLPGASTAVLFFHYHAGLQGALTRARQLLEEAKRQSRHKHGLAVGYLRRSGASEASVQPWTGADGESTASMFGIFAAARGHPLSPRLLADLERDQDELADLSVRRPDVYQAELGRLVRRHTGGEPDGARAAAAEIAGKLASLGRGEAGWRLHPGTRDGAAGRADGSRPQLAARVGVFLRQEAR